MKTIRIQTVLVAMLMLALPPHMAWAWPEEPFAKIEISGPGLNGVATITEAELLGPMTIEGFMDFSRPLPEPAGLGEGYELHRYFLNKDGSWWDFDRVMYYPDPAGGLGYVSYLEGIGYGPAHNSGNWYRVTPEGEVAWQAVMKSIAASAPTTTPSSAPATNPAPTAIALAVGALLVLGGILLQRRPKPITQSVQ